MRANHDTYDEERPVDDSDDCLFCAIIAGDEAAEIVATEERAVAFQDKYPRAPVHVLVASREHMTSADDLTSKHSELLWNCFGLAQRIAAENDIAEGYRIVTNIG